MSALEAAVRATQGVVTRQQAQITALMAKVDELTSRPRTITEEIDAIPGRRIESVLSGEVTFVAAQQGTRGNPILIQVSQDGPFVMTHYPMVTWRPTAPSNASNFGRWRPISTFPLPTQEVGEDIIDISYELQDGGNQRNFQNAPRGPMLSRPDNLVPCAVPTLWAPNSALVFIPTYNRILFTPTGGGWTAATEGTLHVDFIGYRIVNL